MAARGSRDWMARHYGPPGSQGCKRVQLTPQVAVTVKAVAEEAFKTLAAVMAAHGYVIRPGVTGAFNKRYIAGTKIWSNHSWGTAVDINWDKNPMARRLITDMPPAMVADIKQIKTAKSGLPVFRWGGDYRTKKDAMHFELMVTPQELAEGVTAPTVARNRLPQTKTQDVVDKRGKRMIQRGDEGQDVAQLQRVINGVIARSTRLGSEEIHQVLVDGKFGENTERALAHAVPRASAYTGVDFGADWSPSQVTPVMVANMLLAVNIMGTMLKAQTG